MKKTMEIDKNSPKDVHVGDMLYPCVAPDRGYTVIAINAEDDNRPYRIDLHQHLDDETERIVLATGGYIGWLRWVSPDGVSRITRTVDVPDWPTPERDGTAYRGSDGNLYLYASTGEGDRCPWMRLSVNEEPLIKRQGPGSLSRNHPEALPLTELVPRGEATPTIRCITDIREVRDGFLVSAKGCSTLFTCIYHDCDDHNIFSASYDDSLINVSAVLPEECSAKYGDSLARHWLRNDMFDYAIDPIEALGFGGGDEKC